VSDGVFTPNKVQQRIERDHQHLKGRLRPTRGFRTLAGARVLCRGHAVLFGDLDTGPGSRSSYLHAHAAAACSCP
jgi:hypothetical protein